MKKIITLSLLLSAVPLLTAEESPFEELDFAIWPEYDHPGVLILLDGTLRQEALPLHLNSEFPTRQVQWELLSQKEMKKFYSK